VPKLSVTPHIGAVWADSSYMQTFFGVTAAEAADSMFPGFSASQGLRNRTAGINTVYRLDQHWRLGGRITVTRLEGDAASGPLTLDRVNTRDW
jgi:outer membrane protein